MRLLIIFAFLLICLAPGSALAFNNIVPGQVIDDNEITTDIGSIISAADPAIVYRGINAHGNHVVILAAQIETGAHEKGVFATYEISKSGSIVDIVESGTLELDIGTIPALRLSADDSDWFVLKGTDLYSYECTVDGGFEFNTGDSYDRNHSDFERIFDDTFIGVRGYVDFYTYSLAADGTITNEDGPWSPPGFAAVADDINYLSHINNEEYAWYCLTNDENTGWFIGMVDSDGDIQTSWSGTLPFTYINDNVNGYGQTIRVNNNVYLSAWRAITGGHGGDGDIGIETVKIQSVAAPVNTGSGFICDDGGGIMSGAISPAPGSAFVFYQDSGQSLDLYVRAVHNIGHTGFIRQSDITDDYQMSDDDLGLSQRGDSICQLGTSNYVAIFGNYDGDPHLLTFECYLPPHVETTAVQPVLTQYNTKVDGALYASGSVVSIGSGPVTEWGFCWNTTGYPTTSDDKVVFSGTETAPFIFDSEIWDLLTTERYYVRAFACNNTGTGYGDPLESLTYPEYSNIVLAINFEPEDISQTTINDHSGYDHFITYTLATNSPDISITTGPVIPYDYAEYTCEGTECKSFWDPQYVAPENWHLPEGSRNFTNLPGMELPNELIAGTIPVRLFWITAVTLVMISIGLAGYRYLGRVLLVTAALSMCVIFFACTMSWMGWWVFGICLLMTPAPLLKAEARSPFG